MENMFMSIALKEAKRCIKTGDIPIGAVIVKGNKIIAKSHNMRNKKNSAIMHAEIIAIDKACKKLKDFRLEGCEMYVTLEPCPMCAGAILQSRLDKVYIGTRSDKNGAAGTVIDMLGDERFTRQVAKEFGILEEESKDIIQKFFIKLRKDKREKKDNKNKQI